MAYGEVLSRAWQIVRKHKVLWIFGILAGCGSSGDPVTAISSSSELVSSVQSLSWQEVLIVGVIAPLYVAISTLGVIGLIRGTVQRDGEWVRIISFGELFNGSRPYFWRVIMLGLLVGIVVFVLFVPIDFFILMPGLDWTCLVPLICGLVLVFLAASVVVNQSMIAVIVEDLGVRAGLKRGWEVAKANVGTMILMSLILIFINILGMIVIALPLIFLLWQTDADIGAISGWAVCCAAAYLPFLIVLSGILRSFVVSVWTLTFLRLTAPAAPLDQEAFQP